MKRSESEFENIQTDDTIDGAYLSTNELQYPLTKQIQCIHKGLLLNLFRRKKKGWDDYQYENIERLIYEIMLEILAAIIWRLRIY